METTLLKILEIISKASKENNVDFDFICRNAICDIGLELRIQFKAKSAHDRNEYGNYNIFLTEHYIGIGETWDKHTDYTFDQMKDMIWNKMVKPTKVVLS